jgi:branched-chain amino acid aminotransferase
VRGSAEHGRSHASGGGVVPSEGPRPPSAAQASAAAGAVWVNGALVPPGEPVLAPDDRGFTLGDGLFETMRAYGGRVFRLRAHLERLRASADRLGIPVPPDLEDAVRATVAASGLDSAAVRLTVSRGVGGVGLAPPEPARPTVVITARPYAPAERWYSDGLRTVFARGRLSEHALTAGMKRLGYLDQVAAQAEARAAGADEALFLDTAGHLAEGAASNVFLVVGGALWTPPLSCGVLPGITRGVVLELAAASGIPVREEPVPPGALRDADEAFLTSSLRALVPVVAIGGDPIGSGRPGPLTLRLLHLYRERVHVELESGGVS